MRLQKPQTRRAIIKGRDMENARNVGSVITPRANQGFPKNLRGREKGSRIRSIYLFVRKGRTRTRIMIHLRLGADTLGICLFVGFSSPFSLL